MTGGPPDTGSTVELPCGETVGVREIDLGMRELACACGDRHAVVTDVHPPERFLPPFLVEALEATIETADEDPWGAFGTPHLMGLILEEVPGEVAVAEASGDGHVGYAVVWITAFDARQLHEMIVELVVELMDHAISHADDEAAVAAFEEQMFSFDVAAFVDEYRSERDLSSDDVRW